MQLTLHLPALADAFARNAPRLPNTPILDLLLGRSAMRTQALGIPWLHEAFGYGNKLPMARLLAKRDGVTWGKDEDILLAEPVHLIADRDTVRLFPSTYLALDPLEVASMTGALAAQFADFNLAFTASDAGRLFVRLPDSERPETVPAMVAATKRLLDVQPRSSGTLKWHAIQSETEMLLHDHPVNVLREKYGKPRISGLWFWGEGDLIANPVKPFDVVTADTDWVQQLAKEAGIATSAADWSSLHGARVLVHMGTLEEALASKRPERWTDQLAAIDQGWIRQIDHGLWNGNIESLTIITETAGLRHTWHVRRWQHRYCVWKRPRALSSFFPHA